MNMPWFRPVERTTEPPISQNDCLSDLFFSMSKISTRRKPSYCGCWALPCTEGFEPITGYSIDGGEVVIGRNPDGETEYRMEPREHRFNVEQNRVVGRILEDVVSKISLGTCDPPRSLIRRMILDRYDDIRDVMDAADSTVSIDDMTDVIERNTVGYGIFELLLSDPHIEDVYVDAPCTENRIHITMNGVQGVNNHVRCRTNLLLEESELDALVNSLKRDSGLRFCHSSPVMETDMVGFDTRATVIGYPMSPNGNALALRKRSSMPWTLSKLIANGTLDPDTAGLLSFLVNSRTSILIAGARGTGKSSLLGSLMLEFDKDVRILTIEDTLELPGEIMRGLGYKVQSILVDEKMQGDQASRSDEALRVSLRMGESAILLGEVRGEEARTLYRSMNTGKSGSSVMGTIHGDSAESVFHRVVNDMGVSAEAFGSTDVVVVLKMVRNRDTGNMERKVWEIKATTEEPGVFIDLRDPGSMFESRVIKRSMETLGYDREDLEMDIRIRSGLHKALAEAGKMDAKYDSPEWISHIGSMVDVDVDEDRLLDGFRAEVGLGCH